MNTTSTFCNQKKRNNDSQKAAKHTNARNRKASPVGAVKLLAGVPCVAHFVLIYKMLDREKNETHINTKRAIG
jgi:hypothetical protein